MSEKGIKRFTKPAATVLVTAGLIFTGLVGVKNASNQVYGDYASLKDIQQVAEALNCDYSYWQSNNFRMKHNDDEPIYVTISDDFSNEEREEIVKALDYVFGIVGDVNPHYHYDIVDNVLLQKLTDKTVLKIGIKESDDNVNAVQKSDEMSFLARYTGKGDFSKSNTIMFDPDFLRDNKNRMYAVTVHETLHCFGLNDVYCAPDGVYYGNTLMNPMVDDDGPILITPNDYRVILATYAEKFNSEEEKNNYIETSKAFIDEYSKYYYKQYNDKLVQNYIDAGYSENRIAEMMTPVDKNIKIKFNAYENLDTTKYIDVLIKDGQYTISTYDKNMNFISEDSGKAYYVDGQTYLQDVRLECLMRDKTSHMDLCVSLDMLTGNYSLEDLSGLTLSNEGQKADLFENEYQPNN